MTCSVLGLDIGGANLKAAHSGGAALLVPFALWKYPDRLPERLAELLGRLPGFDLLAVTMTGELCDCYEGKRQGVQAILDAVAKVASPAAVKVWRNDGRFVDLASARGSPLPIAAANWLALATYVGRHVPQGPAVLLDIGSTTTDIVPLHQAKPVPRGRTDPERLRCQELVYTGVRRTPLCALLGGGAAAELFATTLDVYLVLDQIPEDAQNHDTADGRPATKAAAHARLARMLCADLETSTTEERSRLAIRALQRQAYLIGSALQSVVQHMAGPPQTVMTAGSGEFLVPAVLQTQSAFSSTRVVPLASILDPATSQAACAHAVAILAREQFHGAA
jgi:probable H4MPT-linked C1 transfer pathway protein